MIAGPLNLFILAVMAQLMSSPLLYLYVCLTFPNKTLKQQLQQLLQQEARRTPKN